MHEAAHLRSEATAELQQNLDRQMATSYPVIDSVERYRDFMGRSIVYGSFPLRRNDLNDRTISIALQAATNPDDPAFSQHAAVHGNSKEAVSALIDGIANRSAQMRVNPHDIEITTDSGTTEVQVKRLAVEAPERARPTFRPGPHQLAIELQNKYSLPEDRRKINRAFRNAASLYGVPFSILACIYFGYDQLQTLDVFDNSDIRRQIVLARKEAGVAKPTVPHKADKFDFGRMHVALEESVLVRTMHGQRPNFSAEGYLKALERFTPEYLRDFSPALKEFVEIDQIVTPRAIFAGMDEVAQHAALNSFADPYRTEYIETKYGNMATTRVVTAYFDVKLEPDHPQFEQLFK